MTTKTFFIILGMALVTYIPRLLPFYLFSNIKFSKRTTFFLRCIPYSALGALIIPDVFNSIEGNSLASFVGAITAIFLTLIFKNLVLTVIGSIIMVYITIIL